MKTITKTKLAKHMAIVSDILDKMENLSFEKTYGDEGEDYLEDAINFMRNVRDEIEEALKDPDRPS